MIMKTLLTILMLLAGCSPVMALCSEEYLKYRTEQYREMWLEKPTRNSGIVEADEFNRVLNHFLSTQTFTSTRTPIYVIYDWKEFCEKWGHNWKEAWVYPRSGDIRYFNPVKGYECRYCRAKKRDVVEEEIWWEE